MYDFGGHLPTGHYMADGEVGMLSALCTIAFAVDKGRVGKRDLDALVRPAVLKYLEEEWHRNKGWRLKQPRAHRRGSRKGLQAFVKSDDGPPPALIEAINNPHGRQEVEKIWNEPRPMPNGTLN